jgi:ATP-binding cassette subfamily B protein
MRSILTVIGYTKKLWPYMIGLALGSVVISLLNLVMPFIIKYATDAIVGLVGGTHTFDPVGIIWFAVAMLAVSVVSNILNDIVGYYGDILAIRLREQLSNRYYEHLLKLPQTYYDTEITGKIINRLNRAIANITQFANAFSNNLLQMIVTLIISTGIMLYYSWMLGALIIILFPTYIWLTGKTSGKWQAYEKEKNQHFDIASGRFNEAITQIRLVKSFGSEQREYDSFTRHFKNMVSITGDQSFFWHKMNSLRNVFLSVIFFVIYAILFYETATQRMSIGDFVLLFTLLQRINMPLNGMSFFIDMYQRAAANSKDYIEAMQVEPEKAESHHREISFKKAKVQFKNIDFSYNDEEQVLHDISFTINPGEKLALVGESGGGKSTITNLLMRLYQPTAGSVLINDENIAEVLLPSLRHHIATVFQDAGLFSGTIRENIAYGRPDASDEDIIKAAKAANAYEFIMKHKAGLETEIGERGIKLSGGQKQRLAIARALLKDAPILILDEATSSLDSRSEALVQEALERLMKKRTVLIIAHRLSTIAHVDTIVTLKNGRIDEVGTPAELAKSHGIYAQLLELQTATTEKARKKLKSYDLSG